MMITTTYPIPLSGSIQSTQGLILQAVECLLRGAEPPRLLVLLSTLQDQAGSKPGRGINMLCTVPDKVTMLFINVL